MKSVVVDGVRLEYRWIGPAPADAPTIVLLHEGLGSAGLWRDFPDHLAEGTGCGALVYSRAGYGGSAAIELPRPLDYMNREGERVVGPLLDALEVTDAILYGHSDGGTIALVHASVDGGARVRGLILEAAHVFCEDVSVAAIERARAAYESDDLRERLRRHHGDNVERAFRGWCDAWLDPGFRRWSVTRDLAGIRCPTLVIQGEDDAYGTLAQVDAIADGVAGPVERLILPGCGHSPHRERAAEVLARVGSFVAPIVDGLRDRSSGT
ncbi:MAG: alpha/beta hydrolase [Nannocystaceae bacterium]